MIYLQVVMDRKVIQTKMGYCWFRASQNVMSVWHFEKIKRFLHCSGKRSISIDCTDKIRPVIETLLDYFQLPAPTKYLCIDEKRLPSKGDQKLSNMIPKNPKNGDTDCMLLLELKSNI